MPYIAVNPKAYLKRAVGTGHCVPYVQAASGAPVTTQWTRGDPVKTSTAILPGTAIATFDSDGKYGNKQDGACHAAIFMSKTAHAITVYDQWKGQPVHERKIRFDNAAAARQVNNADNYYVIEGPAAGL